MRKHTSSTDIGREDQACLANITTTPFHPHALLLSLSIVNWQRPQPYAIRTSALAFGHCGRGCAGQCRCRVQVCVQFHVSCCE